MSWLNDEFEIGDLNEAVVEDKNAYYYEIPITYGPGDVSNINVVVTNGKTSGYSYEEIQKALNGVTIYNNDYSTATEYKQVAVIKNNSDDEDDFQLTNHLLVLAEDSSHRGGTLIPLTDKSAIAFEEDEDTEYAFEPVGEFEESTENLDNTANQ
jgi:hypothetical protein